MSKETFSKPPKKLLKNYNFLDQKVIGHGRFSEMRHCRDLTAPKDTKTPKSKLAMKIIDLQAIKKFFDDQYIINRITKTLARVSRVDNHPNVISIKDTFVDKKNLYMAMNYYPNNMKDFLSSRAGPIDEKLIFILAFQMTIGLEYLHNHEILHNN
jgi:serine/threonine protein kinase